MARPSAFTSDEARAADFGDDANHLIFVDQQEVVAAKLRAFLEP
ncbi:hypothetical protein [Mycobacterium asiaticum]|nr:hypothetical protein [Mycobacterium asiaticum]